MHALIIAALLSQSPEPSAQEGFQKTRWGMSKSDVADLYPGVRPLDDMLWVESAVAGEEASIAFKFVGDRLAAVAVLFEAHHSNKNEYLVDYHAMRALLTKKYGKAKVDDRIWSQDLYKGDSKRQGMAVAMGHLVLISKWETARTFIQLSCKGDNFEVTNALQYVSKEMAQAEQEQDGRSKIDDL